MRRSISVRFLKVGLSVAGAVLAIAGPATAAQPQPAAPGSSDKCPVCGMFVAKYPEFLAQIQKKSGKPLFFDGAKDMFKHYLAMTAERKSEITAIYVTAYYTLKPLEARTAWFVTGSDVNGPMGGELVAFSSEADAKEFAQDHRGKRIVRFKEVTPRLIKELD